MTNNNQKLIELSVDLLNQVSGGCEHKCACEAALENIKKIPDKIADAVPERVKQVPEKVNAFFHEL